NVDVFGLHAKKSEDAEGASKTGHDEEAAAKPGPEEGSQQKPLKDMTQEELDAHVVDRSQALKDAFAKADPEGEKATTLSVGVVEKDGNPETRKVVVTTSADDQKLPQSVQDAMQPGE